MAARPSCSLRMGTHTYKEERRFEKFFTCEFYTGCSASNTFRFTIVCSFLKLVPNRNLLKCFVFSFKGKRVRARVYGVSGRANFS